MGLPRRGPGDLRGRAQAGLGPGGRGAGPRRGPHSHGDPVGASDVEEGATPRAGWLLLPAQQVPLQGGGPGLGSARVLRRVCGQVGGQRLRPAEASPALPAPTGPPASWSSWLSRLRAPSTRLLPIGLSWAQPAHGGGAHSEPGQVQSCPCLAAPGQPPQPIRARLLPGTGLPSGLGPSCLLGERAGHHPRGQPWGGRSLLTNRAELGAGEGRGWRLHWGRRGTGTCPGGRGSQCPS